MKKIFIVLTLVAGLAAGRAQAQLPAAYEARLQFVFDSVCSQLKIKGASAALIVPNSGTWKSGYGISEAGVPITTDMQFGLNSNTKTYTAALMLKLQENSLLDLDDTI